MPPASRKRTAAADATDTPVAKRAAPSDEPQTQLSGGSKTQSQMAAFWRQGKFCDVAVRVEGRDFSAHRIVLAAGSEMLAALSEGGFADSASPTIELQEMSASVFEAVLTYLYDGTCACATSALADVGAAAAFLQVAPLLELVATAIASSLSAETCVQAYIFAAKFNLDGLVLACRALAMENFGALGDTLVALPPDEMRNLLASDELGVDEEEVVLNAALAYARANDADDASLANFFSSVRFTLLPKGAFDRVMQERLLAGPACREMLIRAYAATVYGQASGPSARRVGTKTAAAFKAKGKTAADAKAMGVDGKQIFALCKVLPHDERGHEGKLAVLDDGKYGQLYARDRYNQKAWFVILDGTRKATVEYKDSCLRLLEWA